MQRRIHAMHFIISEEGTANLGLHQQQFLEAKATASNVKIRIRRGKRMHCKLQMEIL